MLKMGKGQCGEKKIEGFRIFFLRAPECAQGRSMLLQEGEEDEDVGAYGGTEGGA